jgi:hypothetical protein
MKAVKRELGPFEAVLPVSYFSTFHKRAAPSRLTPLPFSSPSPLPTSWYLTMSTLTSHLVRRGADVAYASFQPQSPEKQASGLQMLGLFLTVLVVGLAMFSVREAPSPYLNPKLILS